MVHLIYLHLFTLGVLVIMGSLQVPWSHEFILGLFNGTFDLFVAF
jgi:hypothetical protein